MKLQFWRQSLPKAEQIARAVEQEVSKQAVGMLSEMADKWISENKLIHAGAAKRLADKLKGEECTSTKQG
jgi:hypothetical protein